MKPYACALALVLVSVVSSSGAQTWPTKPLRVISPFAPGGTNDTTARIIAERLRARLGQTVIVENRPGANIRVGTELVAKSAPDGYTLLWTAAPHTVNPALYGKLPYDTLADFIPIVHAVIIPILLSVNPSVPAKTVKEYLALAKADPKYTTVASPGSGSGPHLSLELLIAATGIPLIHVPYKGDAPAVTDMMGGQIPAGFNAAGTSLPHVKAGKLRALAVVARQRMPLLPDIATFAEAGFPSVDAYTWFGLVAPFGTANAIVDRLNTEINQILKEPETRERLALQAALPIGGTPAEFDRYIRADLAKWSRVVRERNIKAD